MEAKTDKVAATPAGTSMSNPTSPSPARRRLHPAALRLAAVALLFAGWIGYLAYLVATLPHTASGAPLIVSRSQILVSEVDVIAHVDSTGPGADVTIEEVLYPKENPPFQVGQKVQVVNLDQCKPPPREGEKPENVPADWTGPGSYLLPLQVAGFIGKEEEKKIDYKVVPTPPSPGYPASSTLRAGPPRIYPATEAAKAQYRSIEKPKRL